MIQPGLERIGLLMKDMPLSWRAIHVAGTNGKGSICTYMSNILNKLGIRTGRFASPHIIDRWDCITIEDRAISRSKFLEAEHVVKWRNDKDRIQASEFELLTATAFEIFNREHVDVGVIECGMGGKDDATNVLQKPLLSVITSLGMDHQQYLGTTKGDIARAKAGIMKPEVECVVLEPNEEEFTAALKEYAAERGFDEKLIIIPKTSCISNHRVFKSEDSFDLLDMQKSINIRPINRTNAVFAGICISQVREKLATLFPQVSALQLESVEWWGKLGHVLSSTDLPGRSQFIDTMPLTGRKSPIFVDGAHNAEAFDALRSDLNQQQALGRFAKSVIWLLASSNGRDPTDLRKLIQPSDNVVAVEFGSVDGMPWVKPNSSKDIYEALQDYCTVIDCRANITEGLQRAVELAGEDSMLIVTGSNYLLSDVLRILRDAGCDNSI